MKTSAETPCLNAPTLNIATIDPGKSLTVHLTGIEDQLYVLEHTSDLTTWNTVQVVQMIGGSQNVVIPLNPAELSQFFRIRETATPKSLPAGTGNRKRR